MVLYLSLRRRDQPYLAELDYHSCSATPCLARHSTNCFHYAAVEPRLAAISVSEGCVVFPMKAFRVSISLLQVPGISLVVHRVADLRKLIHLLHNVWAHRNLNAKPKKRRSREIINLQFKVFHVEHFLGANQSRECSTWNTFRFYPEMGAFSNWRNQNY